ncbi:PD-(D/E)XK nuclease family protein [Sphingobacterium hungaricum]
MKTFLGEVAEDLIQKLGADLQDCAIIFNNKRPAKYLAKELAQIYQKPFWSPTFFTIQEFIATSSNLNVADFYTQFFTLYTSYNDLLKKEGLDKIEMDTFFPIAQTLLSDFAQLDLDHIEVDRLFKELEDIAELDQQFDFLTEEQHAFLTKFWKSYSEGKHKKQQENFIRMWRRMPLLYHRFHAGLKAQGLSSNALLYRLLADKKEDNPAFLSTYKKIVFVGFNALSQSEAILFKRWQLEERAMFYFDTDAYYLNDPLQEAGLFLRRNIDLYQLKNELDNQRVFLKDNHAEATVYQVQGQQTQSKILNEILEEDYQQIANSETYGDTVIVLADENLLFSTLQTIPTTLADKQIPVNISMGFNYQTSSLFGLADLWLTYQKRINKTKGDEEYMVPHHLVELFITHPLVNLTEQKRSSIRSIFVQEQLFQVPLDRLLRQKGIFEVFFAVEKNPNFLVKGLSNLFEFVLHEQLRSKSLKKIDAELFDKALQEMNRLQDTLISYGNETKKPFNFSFVSTLIQKSFEAVSVPLSGDPMNGLQVLGLLETRNLNFKHVVFLGMNDGVLPKSSTANSFIPDSIRRVYGLPVIENQDAISAYIFYRLIQRAEKMSFVYNNITDERNSGEPSRFLKQLIYESALQFSFASQEINLQLESHSEVSIPKTPEILAKLNDYLTGKRKLSATALTTYIANPIDFFYRYIAKVEEAEEITEVVEANRLGTILHNSLEDFYREFMADDQPITKERIEQQEAKVDFLIKDNFRKEFYPNETKPIQYSGMQKVIMAIVKEYIHVILKQDKGTTPFRVKDLEAVLTTSFPFEDSHGKTQFITLEGRIDRVDELQDAIRIVDYKTGSDDLTYATLEDAFETNGKKLNKALIQTLFYTYVFEQATGIKNVEPHLYIIRKMTKEGSLFRTRRRIELEGGKSKVSSLELSGELLTEEKEIFQQELKLKLKELFDPAIPFYVSTEDGNYSYSPYKTLMVN